MAKNAETLTFSLPDDDFIVVAERDVASLIGKNAWSVHFRSAATEGPRRGYTFMSTRVYRHSQNGHGVTEYMTENRLDPSNFRYRSERMVQAAAFLGATLAEVDSDRLSTITLVENPMEGIHADPLIKPTLLELGYREFDEQMSEQDLYAPADFIRRSLGATFPVGFSLSPAETA